MVENEIHDDRGSLMHLFLIRHGESEEGKPDPKRALTAVGRKAAEEIARKVSDLPDKPDRLFSSPLLRARETAAPFGQVWGLATEIADWLLPLTAPSQVMGELTSLKASKVALVGHLPHLGLLLSAFTQGLPAQEIVLPRGSVAFLKIKAWEPGGGKLQWLISPEDR